MRLETYKHKTAREWDGRAKIVSIVYEKLYASD